VILAPGSSRLRCCNQTSQPTTGGPDISLLRPELQRQWDHAKNEHLGDRQITVNSSLRVWWNRDQRPCGLPHERLATINGRQSMDHQCPFCTNKRLCQHNSLLTVAQAVAAYWDRAKNRLSPDQVMAGSHTHRHWLCPWCDHKCQAEIRVKVNHKSGCPKCSNKSRSFSRQPSLTQSRHPAMLEFDFERSRS